jgi:hypothetical protein
MKVAKVGAEVNIRRTVLCALKGISEISRPGSA